MTTEQQKIEFAKRVLENAPPSRTRNTVVLDPEFPERVKIGTLLFHPDEPWRYIVATAFDGWYWRGKGHNPGEDYRGATPDEVERFVKEGFAAKFQPETIHIKLPDEVKVIDVSSENVVVKREDFLAMTDLLKRDSQRSAVWTPNVFDLPGEEIETVMRFVESCPRNQFLCRVPTLSPRTAQDIADGKPVMMPENFVLMYEVETQEQADANLPTLLTTRRDLKVGLCVKGEIDLFTRRYDISTHEMVRNKVNPITGLGNLLRYPSCNAELSHNKSLSIVAYENVGADWVAKVREKCVGTTCRLVPISEL